MLHGILHCVQNDRVDGVATGDSSQALLNAKSQAEQNDKKDERNDKADVFNNSITFAVGKYFTLEENFTRETKFTFTK